MDTILVVFTVLMTYIKPLILYIILVSAISAFILVKIDK